MKMLGTRVLAMTLLACGASGTVRADRIDDLVTAQMKRQNIPGLSIAVLRNGRPLKTQGYGLADLELGVRATPQTVYEIGSVSKQFIAAGVLLLSRDGKLGLDDPVHRYLEDAPETWRGITVRHLLTHTSGLVRESPDLQDGVLPELEAIRNAYALPLRAPPGTQMEYSNLGYFTLAEIITRAAHKPWSEYLHERIFAPLAMTATRTTTFEDVVANRARGYRRLDGKFQNAPEIKGVRPSGAFLSTVVDLAKWDAALGSDRLFTAQERNLMWTAVKLNDGTARNYGFGWELSTIAEHRLVRHGGTMIGYRADLSRYLDDGLTVIVLSNSGQALVEKVASGIAALQIKGLQPVRKGTKLPNAMLEAHAGRYQMGNGVLTISIRDGRLALTSGTGLRAVEMALLTPESATRFFDEDNPRPTYAFETDAQGQSFVVMRSEDGKEVMRGTRL